MNDTQNNHEGVEGDSSSAVFSRLDTILRGCQDSCAASNYFGWFNWLCALKQELVVKMIDEERTTMNVLFDDLRKQIYFHKKYKNTFVMLQTMKMLQEVEERLRDFANEKKMLLQDRKDKKCLI